MEKPPGSNGSWTHPVRSTLPAVQEPGVAYRRDDELVASELRPLPRTLASPGVDWHRQCCCELLASETLHGRHAGFADTQPDRANFRGESSGQRPSSENDRRLTSRAASDAW